MEVGRPRRPRARPSRAAARAIASVGAVRRLGDEGGEARAARDLGRQVVGGIGPPGRAGGPAARRRPTAPGRRRNSRPPRGRYGRRRSPGQSVPRRPGGEVGDGGQRARRGALVAAAAAFRAATVARPGGERRGRERRGEIGVGDCPRGDPLRVPVAAACVTGTPPTRASRAPAVGKVSPVCPRNGLTATVAASGKSGGIARAAASAAARVRLAGRWSRIAAGMIMDISPMDQDGWRDRPAADEAVEQRVEVEAVGQVDPQAGRGRVVRPEREQGLRERDQAEAGDREHDQRPFERPGRGRGGSGRRSASRPPSGATK